MVGATAATAAGAAASHASLVTLNLTNNYISGFGGNHLNADLTGDGHPDLTVSGAFTYLSPPIWKFTSQAYPFYNAYAAVVLNGIIATAFHLADGYGDGGRLGSQFGSSGGLSGSIPIFFKDLHINGGTPTEGSLEVFADRGEIFLDSFTYTSNTPAASVNSAVPDQASSLALLAMGAAGVLALRRRRTGSSQNS